MVRPRFGVERSRTLFDAGPSLIHRLLCGALIWPFSPIFFINSLHLIFPFRKACICIGHHLLSYLIFKYFILARLWWHGLTTPRVALRASNFVFQRNTRSIGVHVYLCFHYFDEFPFFFFFFFFSPPPSPNRIRIGNEYRAPILLHSLHWIPDSLLYICSGNARSELINHIDAIFR